MSDKPIPGKVYDLDEFFYNYGHLIVPGSLQVQPHPNKPGQTVVVVGIREEAEPCPANDTSAANNASEKPDTAHARKPKTN